MKILYSENDITFIELKNRLHTSNGALLSHMRFLEQDGFIEFRKEIQGHRIVTIYSITKKGKEEFEKFRNLMFEVLK